jgi:hypothetical protein
MDTLPEVHKRIRAAIDRRARTTDASGASAG